MQAFCAWTYVNRILSANLLLRQCRYKRYSHSDTDPLHPLFAHEFCSNTLHCLASSTIAFTSAYSLGHFTSFNMHARSGLLSQLPPTTHHSILPSSTDLQPTSSSFDMRLGSIIMIRLTSSHSTRAYPSHAFSALQSYRGHRLQRHPGRCWHQLCRPCSCRPPRSRTWPFPSI